MRFPSFFKKEKVQTIVAESIKSAKEGSVHQKTTETTGGRNEKLARHIADLSLEAEGLLDGSADKVTDPPAQAKIRGLKMEVVEAAHKATCEIDQKLSGHEKSEDIKAELAADKAIDVILENPEIRSHMSIDYSFPEYGGRELKPGHRVAFVIPEQFRNRLVRDIVLRHRKDSKYAQGLREGEWDPHGAYSRVELHNTKSGQWKQWRDPAGHNPDKFAESRPAGDPENESLHDWLGTVGRVGPDAVRVTNIGQNPEMSISNIHGLEVVFHPDFENAQFNERIYCKGTNFIDLQEDRLLPTYGGGEHAGGQYEGAIALGNRQYASFELCKDAGPDVRLEGQRMYLKLESGRKLLQAEIAAGDTEYLGNSASGKSTRFGWAKLWVGIRRAASQNTEWFMQNVNVPPQGVLAGGPHIEQADIREGDELVIESRADTSYIMGWRVAYKE